MKTPGDLSERILRALVVQMLRSGAIDEDDVAKASEELEAQNDPEAADSLRCMIIRASAPTQSEWIAENRRKSIRERTAHIAKQADGGKADE
jgi:hypothetical protein